MQSTALLTNNNKKGTGALYGQNFLFQYDSTHIFWPSVFSFVMVGDSLIKSSFTSALASCNKLLKPCPYLAGLQKCTIATDQRCLSFAVHFQNKCTAAVSNLVNAEKSPSNTAKQKNAGKET